MWFGTPLNQAVADIANNSVRSTDNFNWTFIALFSIVVYIYFTEIRNKNYRSVIAGLALYSVHWLYEIVNAVIAHFSGYALWTVSPGSTSFMLLIGVSWELSMMFLIAGLAMSKLLPEDPKLRILGINNRILLAVGNAAFFSIFEVFLASTPAFIWVYSWWGALPVFVTTYIPFFLAAFLVPDLGIKGQRLFFSIVAGADALLLLILVPAGII